jgi:hypothetical protein
MSLAILAPEQTTAPLIDRPALRAGAGAKRAEPPWQQPIHRCPSSSVESAGRTTIMRRLSHARTTAQPHSRQCAVGTGGLA